MTKKKPRHRMTTFLTLISFLLWWVLYSSIGALFIAVIAWSVLRRAERCPVVFNRTYLACLAWGMLSMLIGYGVAMRGGYTASSFAAMFAAPLVRGALVVSMCIGVLALWRLVPRIDAHRIRLASACMAVAVITVIAFGVVRTFA
jgi:hypothetical protein